MRNAKKVRRMGVHLAGLPVSVGVVVLLLGGISAAPGRAGSVPLTDRQRFGFVATKSNWQKTFDVAQLRTGWYVDGSYPICDPAPQGMERAKLLRTRTGYTVNPGQLGPFVDNHPGILWLVGNEPDCIWQDDLFPEEYARIYHDVYTFIKGRDPTSQVSPGGIVQPTPLRLKWLDRVLAEYQARYGESMPVDVWNIHNAILNEVRGSWGAEIPPGLDDTEGEVRAIDDNDNMAMFESQIWAFRQWMADNGYGGYPLIVTEYGILMPKEYGFDTARVNAFMSNTFDFFLTATDPNLGDPTDGNRLVQRWAWFSLDVKPWDPVTLEGYNGNLFNPETTAITAHGQHYASHTSSFPALHYVDLFPGALWVPPASELASPTQTITRSLLVEIENGGTIDSSGFTVTLEYDGQMGGELAQPVANVPPASSRWVTFTLAHLPPGGHGVSVGIDPDGRVDESVECNNWATTTVIAPTGRQYLSQTYGLGAGVASHPSSARTGLEPGQVDAVRPNDVIPGFQEFQVPTADSYPAQIALDAQGRVWISERDGNKLARFDPQTQTWDEYGIPTPGSKPWGLAVDGSGNVWFAETNANQIGQLVLADGAFTEYPITATPNSEPWGVAVGSGAIWFTEKSGNQIGKLVPATGAISEYSLPTPNAQPAGIDAAATYLWFTEPGVDQVGRLRTADGQVLEFTPPTPNSAPQDVVLTGAGKPWFTESGGNKLLAIDPDTAGLFSEIDVWTPDSEPCGIAMEGAIAIWFTERAANKVGRYDGRIPPRDYRLPTPNSQPTDIVVDGDGCAWYTAPGANRIGRFCPLVYSAYLPLIAKD